jgi:hypothetical protein
MLRSTGTHTFHGQSRSCGHLSRKGEALLRLVLLALYLVASFSWSETDSGRNLDPNGQPIPAEDSGRNLDPDG